MFKRLAVLCTRFSLKNSVRLSSVSTLGQCRYSLKELRVIRHRTSLAWLLICPVGCWRGPASPKSASGESRSPDISATGTPSKNNQSRAGSSLAPGPSDGGTGSRGEQSTGGGSRASDYDLENPRIVRVLAIDGGGIRGVIPARIIWEIERRTQRHATELFDCITGTSTGGIIALGLALPGPDGKPRYWANELAEFYSRDGSRIFYRSYLYAIESADGLRRPKYPADSIESWLREKFQEAQLKDALCDVLITSYDIERRRVHLFNSWDARARPDCNFNMRDVARATSAAPTFFPPALIESLADPPKFALIDGGVAANDPAMCGLVDARRRHRAAKIIVVSVGTGDSESPIPYEKAVNWGAAEWALNILDVVWDGSTEAAEEQLRELLPDDRDGPHYFRLQPALGQSSSKMDDASPEHIEALDRLTDDFIAQNDSAIQKICDRLVQYASGGNKP